MPRNETVTSSAIPILVDCGPDQKADGVATWAGSGLDAKRVKIFTNSDRPSEGADLFKTLVELHNAIRKKDRGKAAKARKRLHEIIDKDNRNILLLIPSPEARYFLGQESELRSLLGDKYESKRFSFLGLSDPEPEVPTSDWEFPGHTSEQQQLFFQILSGRRLAPSLETDITMLSWRVSKALGDARLVYWHNRRRLQLALYCGDNFSTSYYAHIFTTMVQRLAVCPCCEMVFEKEYELQDYCSPAHAAADRQRRHRRKQKSARD